MRPDHKFSHIEARREAARATARLHSALVLRVHSAPNAMTTEDWAMASQAYDAVTGAALQALYRANINTHDTMCFLHGSAHAVKAALKRQRPADTEATCSTVDT